MKAYHVIAAEASRHLGRPVRLFMSRREEFIASHQRASNATPHPAGRHAQWTTVLNRRVDHGSGGSQQLLCPQRRGCCEWLAPA